MALITAGAKEGTPSSPTKIGDGILCQNFFRQMGNYFMQFLFLISESGRAFHRSYMDLIFPEFYHRATEVTKFHRGLCGEFGT